MDIYLFQKEQALLHLTKAALVLMTESRLACLLRSAAMA